MEKIKNELKTLQKALMTGVSYMMPLVVAGGILMAFSLMGGTPTATGMKITIPFLNNLNIISKAGFAMMVPVLGGYIAYSIAGRPGLAPGFILGFLANNPIGDTAIKSGFLGALLMGILAGYFVKWMKSWKVPNSLKAIMPILIIPMISTFVLGMFYIYVVAGPVVSLSTALIGFLTNLSKQNIIIFAIVLGLICEIDMGGPITKTVTIFTIAMMAEGMFAANGMYRAAVGVPPLAIMLSTMLFRDRWTDGDRTASKSAGIMGFMGITEGAIPFVVNDLKHILPSTMIGCAVATVIAALGGVTSPVPHGSFITLPVVTNPLWFVVAIVAGSLVGAILMGITRPKLTTETKLEQSKE